MTDRSHKSIIERSLFETGALRISPENKPFWYTSGTIGPYYINTHFLYGSEEKANELLVVIDAQKDKRFELPGLLAELVIHNYHADEIFKSVIDCMVSYINDHFDVAAIELISGGERRDWFFSIILAHLLKKRHLTIYKDLQMVVGKESPEGRQDEVFAVEKGSMAGLKCLHISDLVTEASSYQRAWEPALQEAGSHIDCSLTIVDRLQGGGEVLRELGIEHHAMTSIDASLFKSAMNTGHINPKQFAFVVQYKDDPKTAMRDFLIRNPEFIDKTILDGGKDAGRAKLCLEKNIYQLPVKS